MASETLFDPAGLDGVTRSAVFSSDRRFRFVLRREWAPRLGAVLFVGLNPSTADEQQDDPTIRRCMRFARDWGYGAMWMGNLYAYRSTDPDVLTLDAVEGLPLVGLGNTGMLADLSRDARLVVAAWGAHPAARKRSAFIAPLLDDPHVLGLCQDGSPRHPLYMPAATRPTRWIR